MRRCPSGGTAKGSVVFNADLAFFSNYFAAVSGRFRVRRIGIFPVLSSRIAPASPRQFDDGPV
jgi:hypothetical protein